MGSNQQKPEYNLSELTTVAFDTVQAATGLALTGYSEELRKRLEQSNAWTKGWFAEGIGQGLYLHDLKHENDFEHTFQYLNDDLDSVSRVAAYVGIGLAIGYTGVFSETFYDQLDKKDRPWLFDGLGFYNTIVSKSADKEGIKVHEFVDLDSDRQSAFHSGIGRGLWFSLGENRLDDVMTVVQSFPKNVQPWIWRGLGFVSTYAGASEETLYKLKEISSDNLDYLKIGCVIAVVEQGKSDVPHREKAARTLVGKSIAEIVDLVLANDGPRNHTESISDATSSSWMKKTLGVLK